MERAPIRSNGRRPSRRGATVIEAYPNFKPDFMGRLEAFERRGFIRTRSAGKRSIVRLTV
jgi:hypothetical protein